jgi:hypothetical protein
MSETQYISQKRFLELSSSWHHQLTEIQDTTYSFYQTNLLAKPLTMLPESRESNVRHGLSALLCSDLRTDFISCE